MRRTAAVLIGLVVALGVVAAVLFLLTRSETAGPSSDPDGSGAPTASGSLSSELLDRRWTVLLVGTDHNTAREEAGDPVNADSLLLASLSADGSELALVSLPRDTVDVPLPDGSTSPGKVNALYREVGVDALRGALEELYAVPIDAHVVLDMEDVASLIEAAGGVEVNPPEPLADPIVDLDLDAGAQELDAAAAMGYVRTRVDQDYGRMRRQQEVLVNLVERLSDDETDMELRPLIEGLDSLETDLPLDELPTLIELARRASEAEVANLIIEPPLIAFEGDRGDGRGYVLEPDVEAIRSAVQSLIGD